MCHYFLSILSILELTVDTYWIFHAIPHPSPLLSYFCQFQIHPFSASFTNSVRKGYRQSKRQDEGRRDFCPRLLAGSCSTRGSTTGLHLGGCSGLRTPGSFQPQHRPAVSLWRYWQPYFPRSEAQFCRVPPQLPGSDNSNLLFPLFPLLQGC